MEMEMEMEKSTHTNKTSSNEMGFEITLFYSFSHIFHAHFAMDVSIAHKETKVLNRKHNPFAHTKENGT